jgi:hypothetical protein
MPLSRQKLSESAVPKGVKHQVCYRLEDVVEHRAQGKPKYWDSFEKPYAVFKFKYRSRGMYIYSAVERAL